MRLNGLGTRDSGADVAQLRSSKHGFNDGAMQ
jgi:hypothetical protein